MRRFYQDKGGASPGTLECVPSTGLDGAGAREQLTRALERVRYIAHPVSMDVYTFTLGGKVRTALVFGDQHTDIEAMESTCKEQPRDQSAKLQFFIGLVTCNARTCVDVYWEYPYLGSFATRPYGEQVDGIYKDVKRNADLMLLRTGANFTPCFDPNRSVEACKRLGNARFHAVDYRHVEVFDALLGPLMALCRGSIAPDSPQAYGRVAEQLLTRSPLHLAYFLLTLLGVDMKTAMETSLPLLLGFRMQGDDTGRVRFAKQLTNAVTSGGHTGYFLVAFGGAGPPRCFQARTHEEAKAALSRVSGAMPDTGAAFVFDARGGVLEKTAGPAVSETHMKVYGLIARGSCLMVDNPYADAYTQALGVVMDRLRSMLAGRADATNRTVSREQLKMVVGHIFLPPARAGQPHKHGQHAPSDRALDHICRKLERRRAAMTPRAWDGLTHAIASTLLERLGGGAAPRWSDDTYLRIMLGADEQNCIEVVGLLDDLNVPVGALFMDMMSIPRLLTSDATISITAAGHAHTSTLLKALTRMGATPVHSSPVEVDQATGKYKKCVRNFPKSYVPTFVDSLLSVDAKCTITSSRRE